MTCQFRIKERRGRFYEYKVNAFVSKKQILDSFFYTAISFKI